MEKALLLTIAASVLLGAAGQALASLARLPAIVFLLLMGICAGPFGLNLVRPDALGEQGLQLFTAAFVAIILFEGGLTLRPRILRQAMEPVKRLITIGALITLLGGAVLAHLILGLSWTVSFLFSSLIVVTGPTVISPILRRVRLQPRLHATLKSESILIDPIGAILSVVVLQYVVGVWTHEGHWSDALMGFFARSGLGILIGAGLGACAALLLRLPFFQHHENEHVVSLGALGIALGAFASAECLFAESGIMAVTVAGLVLASGPLPFRKDVEKFKENLTVLGVSVLFILLAAHIDLSLIRAFGWRELLLVAAVIFVLRPISVWVSTWGTELTWREKTYLSLLAPRGIVAAAMAGHFASHLAPHDPVAAQVMESLVFLTIAVTVFGQGAWAGPLARWLKVENRQAGSYLLVGVNEWSMFVADLLRERGEKVVFLDSNPFKVEWAQAKGYDIFRADACEPDTYERLDPAHLGCLVAMTPNDAINTMACDAARPFLGADHVFQILSKPLDARLRSRVRLSGKRAFPSLLAHDAICDLLGRGEFRVETSAPGQHPSEQTLVPILFCEGKRNRLATEQDKAGRDAVWVALLCGQDNVDGAQGDAPNSYDPAQLANQERPAKAAG